MPNDTATGDAKIWLTFESLVASQLKAAHEKHAPYTSVHQAYGLLCEEMQEFFDEVRKKRAERDPERMRHELADICVVCHRAAEAFCAPTGMVAGIDFAKTPEPATPGTSYVAKCIEAHAELLMTYPFCYIEIAYTRTTDWMVHIMSHPKNDHRDFLHFAQGQGLTAEDAAKDAWEKLQLNLRALRQSA